MVFTPPAGVTPVDRKPPSAPSLVDIPAVLDWLRGYYGGATVLHLLITATAEQLTYRVDSEGPYVAWTQNGARGVYGLTIFGVSGGGNTSGAVAQVTGKIHSHNPGIMIPLYIYPSNAYTNADYDNLIALAKNYPTVSITAIINNANGPGGAQDGNFTVAIRRLHGAAITVIGYVDTNNATIAASTVHSQVSTWKQFYPEIDGIFFDQMTNDVNGAHIAYYQELRDFVHANNLYPCIMNPGAPVPPIYEQSGIGDIICTWENTYYPDEATIRGNYAGEYAEYPVYTRAALVHSQTFDPIKVALLAKYHGLIYITNDTLPNPWDTLSPYLEATVKLLARVGLVGILPPNPQVKTTTYAAAVEDSVIFADVSAASWTLTLPAVYQLPGKEVSVVLTANSANSLTVQGAAGTNINGIATRVMTGQGTSLRFATNGIDWWVVN